MDGGAGVRERKIRREPKGVEYDDGKAPEKPKTALDYVKSISWLHVFFLLLFVLPTAFGMYEWLANNGYLGKAGKGGGAKTPRVNWAMRESIKSVYRDYNPAKLEGEEYKKLTTLMDKYAGREEILLRKIAAKYKNKRPSD